MTFMEIAAYFAYPIKGSQWTAMWSALLRQLSVRVGIGMLKYRLVLTGGMLLMLRVGHVGGATLGIGGNIGMGIP